MRTPAFSNEKQQKCRGQRSVCVSNFKLNYKNEFLEEQYTVVGCVGASGFTLIGYSRKQ